MIQPSAGAAAAKAMEIGSHLTRGAPARKKRAVNEVSQPGVPEKSGNAWKAFLSGRVSLLPVTRPHASPYTARRAILVAAAAF